MNSCRRVVNNPGIQQLIPIAKRFPVWLMHLQIVPDKRAGLNGSTQHWLEVYLQESRELNLFASFESNGTLPRLGPIEHGPKDRFFVRSIVESTD
jgi:hypothetical protein